MFNPKTSNLKLFLLQAALPHPDREKLAGALQAITDWDEAIQNLQQEGILPFFYDNLKKLDLVHLLPGSAKKSIKERLRRQAMHQLNQDSVFAELAGLLNQHQIPFIPIKGMTLRHHVYATPALRPMLDLDLLIKPEDAERITHLMKELGARQAPGLHSEYLNSLQHHRPPMQYRNTPIEFHTSFFRKTSHYNLTPETAWQKNRKAILLNQEIKLLIIEINLVYITIHAYNHLTGNRFKLIWLTDVCLYLQKMLIDWNKITNLQQNEADKKAFYAMMGLMEELDQFSFPEKIQSELRPKWTQETQEALEKHLQGHRSNQKTGVLNALGRLDNQEKIKFITSVLFPSKKFMRKKYMWKNRFTIIFLYPYHIFIKIMEGLYYLAIRGKSKN